MPFGAEVLGDGRGSPSGLPPPKRWIGSWKTASAPCAAKRTAPSPSPPGTRYRYRLDGGEAAYRLVGERGLSVRWTLEDGSLLALLANLGPEPLGGFERPPGKLLYASEGATGDGSELPAWSVAWHLARMG